MKPNGKRKTNILSIMHLEGEMIFFLKLLKIIADGNRTKNEFSIINNIAFRSFAIALL